MCLAFRAASWQFVWSVNPTESFTRRGILLEKPIVNRISFFSGSVSSVIVVATARHWLLPIWTRCIHSSPYDLFTTISDCLHPRLHCAISQVTASLTSLLRCSYCIGIWQNSRSCEVTHYVMVLTPVSFSARRSVNTEATFQRVTIMTPLLYLLHCRRSIIGSCSNNISFWPSASFTIHLLLSDCSVTLVFGRFDGWEVNSSVPGNSVGPCVDTVFPVLFRYDTLTGQRFCVPCIRKLQLLNRLKNLTWFAWA
jgi:hypothetical protein